MILHKKTVNNNNAATISGVSSMRVFGARISQTGTNDPTVVQIVNTLGATLNTATRLGVGTYRLSFTAGAFILGKTICLLSGGNANINIGFGYCSNTVTNLNILTYDSTGTLADEVLSNTSLYVEVFPS